MKGRQFEARVEAVYTKHTGVETRYGCLKWFGAACGKSRRAVWRWFQQAVVDGPQVTVLRLLEYAPAGTPWAVEPELFAGPMPQDFPSRGPLVAAGIDTVAAVWFATDAALLEVPGIGPATLERIRAHILPRMPDALDDDAET